MSESSRTHIAATRNMFDIVFGATLRLDITKVQPLLKYFNLEKSQIRARHGYRGSSTASEVLHTTVMTGSQCCGTKTNEKLQILIFKALPFKGLTFPPPGVCFMLSLEPQRDWTLDKSSFLSRIWTFNVRK